MSVLLGILAVVVLAGCKEEKKAVELPPPIVTVTAAEQREVKDWDEYTGRLAPMGTVEVRPCRWARSRSARKSAAISWK